MRVADKLMRWWLDKGFTNKHLSLVLYRLYVLLVWNAYVVEHKEANHHYIPRFLLKRFVIPGTGLIYQYSLDKTIKAVSIEKDAAHIPNLYSFKDKAAKSKSDFVENQLFALGLEKYASRIINKILKEDRLELTNIENSIVASFMAFQYVRTPHFLFLIRSILQYLHLQKGVPIEAMTKLRLWQEVFFSNVYKLSPRDIMSFSLKNRLAMRGADDLVLFIALWIGNEISIRMSQYDLRMLEARNPAYFYLSDSPMGIYNVHRRRPIGPFLWELSENPLYYMPISPSRCLYFIHPLNSASASTIGSIIEVAIPESLYKFAYSDRNSLDIARHFETDIERA